MIGMYLSNKINLHIDYYSNKDSQLTKIKEETVVVSKKDFMESYNKNKLNFVIVEEKPSKIKFGTFYIVPKFNKHRAKVYTFVVEED